MQTSSHLVWTKGRGRGFRPAGTFNPARRPGERKPHEGKESSVHTQKSSENEETGASKKKLSEKDTGKYIAKYSYKANQDSPLGEAELSLSVGQYVTLVEKHKDNDMWCKVINEGGETGFVPTKYLQAVEEKITTLPWLANKQIDEEKDNQGSGVKGPYKAYVSAYNKPEPKPAIDLKQYYCDVCEKQLNGPLPYKAHMMSKAHKLEVELAEEREQDIAAAAAADAS